MKSNPGGEIDSDSVIGRDAFIQHLWEVIEQQSIVLTAERRIGKTTIIKKMRSAPASGWVPVFQDLERCHTAMEFAMVVYKEVNQFLSGKQKAARRGMELLKSLGGVEVAGLIKLPSASNTHWKEMLTQTLEDLIHENDSSSTRLLFLWDEVPFMLANIRDREGERTAMEVLDTLRALRQTLPGLRMILTGSIGLHHVLHSLRDKQYANDPFNDMAEIEVHPIAEPDAAHLAAMLIQGEMLQCSDQALAAAAISQEAGCFPFYIHHVVRALKSRGLPASPDSAQSVVADHLLDAGDPWKLRHYHERLRTYYGNHQPAVLIILDELAVKEQPPTVNELLALLKASSTFDDREMLLRLLSLLERDHYLRRNAEGRHTFKFPLIRRWWQLHRSL
ncbi:hypothetical protein [Prosthecobacter vanneervenii]|uniref:ATP-binding protein n=1 Tax=Prosthecobacter vanneervenii TaxID=48466 RepID=A0A7W7YG46_9BACT|nr:hypothetical protein [Prosthecobacter vanneervenii]MBB5035542.1 hypothetical protein [Prosthecobacter vanneervenii]